MCVSLIIFQQYVLRLLLAVQEWNFFDLISQTGLQADLKGFTIHLIPETCAALSQGKIVMGQFVRYKTSPCEKEVHLINKYIEESTRSWHDT